MARFLIVWGNGAPIPGFPRPCPEFSGTGRGRGRFFEKYWGLFGDGDDFNFGDFWGFIPKNPRKKLGKFWGQG